MSCYATFFIDKKDIDIEKLSESESRIDIFSYSVRNDLGSALFDFLPSDQCTEVTQDILNKVNSRISEQREYAKDNINKAEKVFKNMTSSLLEAQDAYDCLIEAQEDLELVNYIDNRMQGVSDIFDSIKYDDKSPYKMYAVVG